MNKQLRQGSIAAPARIGLLHSRFAQQRPPPEGDPTWIIGSVVYGSKHIAAPAAMARQGDIYLLRPEQAGAGIGDDTQGCEFAALYIPDAEWRRQCARHGVQLELAMAATATQPFLALRIATFVFDALQSPRAAGHCHLAWQTLCDDILGRCPQPWRHEAAKAAGDMRVSLARDYLRTHWNSPVSLDVLAQRVSLSAFELNRRFRAAYGLPPHRYQLALRVMEARARLLDGVSIADVASATGFADQSHLGRQFKAMLGMTPGMAARAAHGVRGEDG